MRALSWIPLAAAACIGLCAPAIALAGAPVPLRVRAQAYLDGLLRGERSPMLEVEDYYPRIYVVSDAKIERLEKVTAQDYRLDIRFKTSAHFTQGFENGKSVHQKIKQAEEFVLSLRFDIQPTFLHFSRKFQSPLVHPGREVSYLKE